MSALKIKLKIILKYYSISYANLYLRFLTANIFAILIQDRLLNLLAKSCYWSLQWKNSWVVAASQVIKLPLTSTGWQNIFFLHISCNIYCFKSKWLVLYGLKLIHRASIIVIILKIHVINCWYFENV